MTHPDLCDVPGMTDLLGRGVYTAMPDEMADTLRGQRAVVVGDPVAGAAAALRLRACGCFVTLVTRESARGSGIPSEVRAALRAEAGIDMRHGMELSCAVGIDHLEALVLRRIASGCIEAWNATALFVISPAPNR